jgi:Peptidase family S58
LPIVAETYDGSLNEINGQQVRPPNVFDAIDRARSGPVPEGNVGGGTGMICFGFKPPELWSLNGFGDGDVFLQHVVDQVAQAHASSGRGGGQVVLELGL